MRKDLIILNDIVFKSLFKTCKEFREMMDDILKYYFDVSIKGYKIHSEEMPIQNKNDHPNRMDIFLTDENNKRFMNIESNLGNKSKFLDYYVNRNLVYACKLIIWAYNDSKYNEKYKAIQINLNDIESPFDEGICSSLMLYDVKNNKRDDRMTIHNLYLGKYRKLSYNKLTELECDLKMLVCDDEEEMKILSQNNKRREKIMREYKKLVSNEEFFRILFDPERERELYDRTMQSIAMNEGKEVGKKEGKKEGIVQGRNEAKEEIAKKMISKNISIEEIKDITNLSIEEIQKLKSN